MTAIASSGASRIFSAPLRLLPCYVLAVLHNFPAPSRLRQFCRNRPIPRPKLRSYSLLHSPAISPDPYSTPSASTKPNDIAEAIGRRTRVDRPGPRGLSAPLPAFTPPPSLRRS